MSEKGHFISIWFFIGIVLIVYGLLITGAGIYELFSPPEHPVVVEHLHAAIWWWLLLLALGSIYCCRFFPRKI